MKRASKFCGSEPLLFENELNYDISNYSVHRALDNLGLFTKLFKYQINEFPLYKKHYLLPQYEGEEEEEEIQEEAQAEVAANIKKCSNCGWIISADTEICPKCKRSTNEKFES